MSLPGVWASVGTAERWIAPYTDLMKKMPLALPTKPVNFSPGTLRIKPTSRAGCADVRCRFAGEGSSTKTLDGAGVAISIALHECDQGESSQIANWGIYLMPADDGWMRLVDVLALLHESGSWQTTSGVKRANCSQR
jgi:hypothetical protein